MVKEMVVNITARWLEGLRWEQEALERREVAESCLDESSGSISDGTKFREDILPLRSRGRKAG